MKRPLYTLLINVCCTLYTLHSCVLYTLHSTLYTHVCCTPYTSAHMCVVHSTPCTHVCCTLYTHVCCTLYTLYSTLYTHVCCTLYTLHSCVLCVTLYTLHSCVLYTLHSALTCVIHSKLIHVCCWCMWRLGYGLKHPEQFPLWFYNQLSSGASFRPNLQTSWPPLDFFLPGGGVFCARYQSGSFFFIYEGSVEW